MAQTNFSPWKYSLKDFLHPRWFLIVISLVTQTILLSMVLVHLGEPAGTDITLAPVADNPGFCQVVALRPFSDAWVRGIQTGTQVKIIGGQTNNSCSISGQSIQLEVLNLPEHPLTIIAQTQPADFLDIATALLLIIIFDVTGIAIFLRGQNRQAARVTYALFTCVTFILCLINLRGATYFWLNLLGFTTAMLVRGLSVTFVCLFPYASQGNASQTRVPLLPYAPLLIGILLAISSAFMPILPISTRFIFMVLGAIYNGLCVLIAIWVMTWGLRHLRQQEKQFVRMVVIGLLFLLIPLALNLNIIRTDTIVQQSLVRLIPIPLAVLPIACDYALFRQHLLGMTSMLSRQAMRGLLWLLLACVFLFPSIILMRYVASLHFPQETRDYIYAGLLVVSLLLFPRLWSKVRDAGDQVFYQDFYEYNRSLRDLSAALTHLQGMEQISSFMLPRLATLLNTTETGLLLRTEPGGNELAKHGKQQITAGWRMYRHISPRQGYATSPSPSDFSAEQLTRIADLGLMYVTKESNEPLLLHGVLLLALYACDRCSGFLYLGPKLNLESYSKEDRSFLSTLASQISVLEVNSRYLEQAQADALQMTALSHRVISAQEEERRHLALELHDEVLQQSMLVVRQLSDASDMAEVAEVMPLARAVVASLRRTCLELRPPLLDELGLVEAFHWLVRQTAERSAGTISLHITCLGNWGKRPAASVELALYRVGQEALSNAFKYAGASKIVIRLRWQRDGYICLVISDNGRGMRNKRPLAENLGLVGMHERMAAIDGTLHIRTSPGHGVTIRAKCPSMDTSTTTVPAGRDTQQPGDTPRYNTVVQQEIWT